MPSINQLSTSHTIMFMRSIVVLYVNQYIPLRLKKDMSKLLFQNLWFNIEYSVCQLK